MADGNDIGALARLMFPGGVLIDAAGPDAVLATESMMQVAHTLFEPQFVSGGRLVRVDILQRDGDAWRLLEVKSSKEPGEKEKVKSHHLYDVAFQVLVLREAGINVKSASLVLISRDYVAPENGGLDPSAALAIVEVTNEVEAALVDVQFKGIAMQHVISQEEAPFFETNTYCSGCGFHAHCHVGQPEDDLVFIPRIKATQVSELRAQGVKAIGAVPESYKLQEIQARIRNVYRDGTPYVAKNLPETLEAVKFPVYFIDFEAAAYSIPVLPGTASYQAIPFQWSCHVLESREGELMHFEFLAVDGKDPRAAFAETLWNTIQSAGSIFVYSNYEMTTLKALAKQGVRHGAELCELLSARGVDLLKIVQESVYLKAFKGSFSIKSVLPAMVPAMSYKDLTIRDGNTAAAEYKRMIAATTPISEKEQICRDLLAYCKRDTEAMVELFAAMWKLCDPDSDLPAPDDFKHDQLILNL
jgi:predicted RecB family nuclease